MSIFVTLNAEQIAFADRMANRRNAHAISVGAKHRNGMPDAMGLKAHILGMRTEFAGALGMETKDWNCFHEHVSKEIPDLAGFIDVKGVRSFEHRLIIKKAEGQRNWAYLLVSAESHPRYELIKWCWGFEAMRPEFWMDPVGGRAAYFVSHSVSFMRPAEDLRALVAERDLLNSLNPMEQQYG